MGNVKNAIGLIAITIASAAVASLFFYDGYRTRAANAASLSPTIGSFDRVRLTGAFSTTITVGKESHIGIRGDANAIRNVTTAVRDGTLTVGERDGSLFHTQSVALAIDLPHLRSFANDGAGNISISGIADDIELANSGAGSIKAAGRAGRETVSLAGVGNIDTQGIDARDVSVESDGVGAVYVRGSGTLDLTVNGVGEIRYAGHPAHVDQRVDGVGHIGPA
jgi:hypothetical protein